MSCVYTLKDANISGIFPELPSSETMTCRQEQKLERESINTETYIQEESRKTIRKRTLRTEKKAGILTEITRSRIDNNGVLEECKNGDINKQPKVLNQPRLM